MNAIGFDGLFVSLGFIRFVSQMNVKQPVGCNVWFNLIDFGVFFFFFAATLQQEKKILEQERSRHGAGEARRRAVDPIKY